MPRVRTFIAIDPGKAIQDRLVALQENLTRDGAQVKWVERDNLHITLLFLGEVEERALGDLCRAVAEGVRVYKTFEVAIEGAGCFPNPRRPRILWVGLGKGIQETVAVHDALESPLLDLGCYRREERRFTPHVTLGRIRGERPAPTLGTALQKYQAFKAGETVVREIHVMSSQLTPTGPVYTVMSRAKLS